MKKLPAPREAIHGKRRPNNRLDTNEIVFKGHEGHRVKKHGFYDRKCDGRKVQRYFCWDCNKNFSEQTNHHTYRQQKPWVNHLVFMDLCSGISQRKIALNRKVSRHTVALKIRHLAAYTEQLEDDNMELYPLVENMQFDELETFERTKCKPLSILLCVEGRTRRILDVRAYPTPPKGKFAKRATKKYGKRRSERIPNLHASFQKLQPYIDNDCKIRSDCHRDYPASVKKYFPTAIHKRFLSRRASYIGNGEIKVGARDPLFSVNHTACMLRYDLSRLIRKTWCTTKCQTYLNRVLQICRWYHNNLWLHRPRGQRA